MGTATAWIVERADALGRALALPLSVLPLVFPGILANLAWILLASPRIGALNQFARDVLGARPVVRRLLDGRHDLG